MGRKRTRDFDLPQGVYRKRNRYYFGAAGLALGGPSEWFSRYAELRGDSPLPSTFADAAVVYRRDELHRKAPKTQDEYSRQLTLLVRVFGNMRLDDLAPGDVRDYLDLRPRIAGTREKALLSAVFNFARGRRLTASPNPCAGIHGHRSTRHRYVTDAELAAAIRTADSMLADFLRLCYYTGQRPSDVLRICPAHAQEGRLRIDQGKTGATVRIRLAGPLASIFKRLAKRPLAPLILGADGAPTSVATLRKRFDALGLDWQIRDLRAKAASDLPDVAAARLLLGHTVESTTDAYRRSRVGRDAEPLMRRVLDKRPR